MRGNRSTSIQAAALGSLIGLLSVACGGKSITDGADKSSNTGGTVHAGGASTKGGATGTGGTSGSSSGTAATAGDTAAAGDSCSIPPDCGGDLVATWSVVSSCLLVSGQLDLSPLGISCAAAAVTGYRHVTGTWSAHADGTYVDATTTTGVDQLQLAPACLSVSGTQLACDTMAPILTIFGYNSASCEAVPKGGCACSAKVEQSGGLGVVSEDTITYGTFSASGNVVTIDGRLPYSYCAARGTLTWTPKTVNPTITGSIGFERAAM